jgi:hypothetical protein
MLTTLSCYFATLLLEKSCKSGQEGLRVCDGKGNIIKGGVVYLVENPAQGIRDHGAEHAKPQS